MFEILSSLYCRIPPVHVAAPLSYQRCSVVKGYVGLMQRYIEDLHVKLKKCIDKSHNVSFKWMCSITLTQLNVSRYYTNIILSK